LPLSGRSGERGCQERAAPCRRALIRLNCIRFHSFVTAQALGPYPGRDWVSAICYCALPSLSRPAGTHARPIDNLRSQPLSRASAMKRPTSQAFVTNWPRTSRAGPRFCPKRTWPRTGDESVVAFSVLGRRALRPPASPVMASYRFLRYGRASGRPKVGRKGLTAASWRYTTESCWKRARFSSLSRRRSGSFALSRSTIPVDPGQYDANRCASVYPPAARGRGAPARNRSRSPDLRGTS